MARSCAPAEIPKSPDLSFEAALWAGGLSIVAGLDEAGRGAWAGPVSAAAVVLPADAEILHALRGVRDSKQMSPPARAFWAEEIRAHACSWGVGFAESSEIDAMGIVPATRLAMTRALAALPVQPGHLLIDALRLPGLPVPQTDLIKGDARSLSIAAASVLAKTARDAIMVRLSDEYPQYGFDAHKGYGTTMHQAALGAYGPCPAHRCCFAPIRSLIDLDQVEAPEVAAKKNDLDEKVSPA